MNYIMAVVFIVINGVAAIEVKKIFTGDTNLDFKTKQNTIFIGGCILLMLLTAEFIILANGFTRLMEM